MIDTTIPQLRCRTEYAFRAGRNLQTFAPLSRMAARLAELGAPAAGIVDGGTWGHARWGKACAAAGVRPLFGTEFTVKAEGSKQTPKAWVLGADMARFYRFSTDLRRDTTDIHELLWDREDHIVAFAGAALTDPGEFDFVDINPASPLDQRHGIELARATNKPLVLTSDNRYAQPSDYAAFMAISGQSRVTPQHLLSVEEMRAQFRTLSPDDFAAAVRNTHAAAERCASVLPKAPMIHFEGDLVALTRAGRAHRLAQGHIAAWTDEYNARMERELMAIAEKGFESYFLVVADLVQWAKARMLVGPGRGSSAGSLVCYLLGITEVDPLPHGLLFERFIDLTRKDLPDIDIDFSDRKREGIFTYLAEKYGRESVARIGSVGTMQPRTVMGRIGEVFGIAQSEVFGLTNVLVEYSSGDSRYGRALEDTLELTDYGRRFISKYPEARLMGELEGHATHSGVHAAGVIVSNVPVVEYCTVGADGVAQLDKKDAEELNLLKIDALGLSTLGIIEDAGVVTADELYALKLDDPEVFKIFNDKKYVGVFQFEGHAQRSIAVQVHVDQFRTLDHLTALARPGPMGGGATNTYIARANGREPVAFRHPSMAAHLGETLGVTLYQEQVMRIGRELGNFTWEQVTLLRKAMSGRKGEEYFNQQGELFVTGAAKIGLSEGEARSIWREICAFGAWGMNKSHTVAYSVISYWCAWMKVHHPVAYAAACLRSCADDEDKALALLREIVAEGTRYVPFDIDRSDVDWAVVDGELIGGFKNLVGFGPAKSVSAVEARRTGTMDQKLRDRIAAAHVKFQELRPLYAAYKAIFDDPTTVGCREGSRIATADNFPERGDVLYVGRVTKKAQRDENETVRVARRGVQRKTGPTLFADFTLKDDTGVPTICRVPAVERYNRWGTGEQVSAGYEKLGKRALELLQEDDVLLIRGSKIPNFPMIQVLRMKVLNREVAL